MNYWTQSCKNVFVAAHRGFSEKYPENTLEAFRAALALGVDQIETDIRITADGELVLIHDATVDRTTNGTGKVCEKTYAELYALDAGVRKGAQFSGAHIPKLEELFELVKDHPTLTLDLELKEYVQNWNDDTPYRVCDRVIAMVKKYGFKDRVIYNTFDGRLHAYLKKTDPAFRRHVYFPDRVMANADEETMRGAYSVCVFDSEHTLDDILAFLAKYDLRAWMPAGAGQNEEALDKALLYKPEFITCNDPETVMTWLRARGLRK